MKKQGLLKFLLIFFGCSLSVFATVKAQAPGGYYNAAIGKSGSQLRLTLHNIIKNHTDIMYNGAWQAFYHTDVKPNGKLWDIYSDIPNGEQEYEFTLGTNKCGNYSGEGDCYNREHTVPQSWFNDAVPMQSDLFHLYPTDGWVNNKRGNFPYGEVENATWVSLNGSKLGTCSYPGYTGTVFEPITEYKGDIARGYFYMCVAYMDKNLGQDNLSMFQGGNLKPWALSMLLEWHNADPVSQKEIDRNNAIYSMYQHNRNPFIDCPELVQLLFTADSVNAWLPTCFEWDPAGIDENVMLTTTQCRLYPNPTADFINIQSGANSIKQVEVVDMAGRLCLRAEGDGSRQMKVDLESVKAGCYFVKVYLEGKIEVLKVIIR